MNFDFTRAAMTRLFLWTLVVCTVSAPLVIASRSGVDSPNVPAALDDRPYVVLVRHGDAPGRNEPQGFDLNDCSTQRNLSDKGRVDARALGETLRARGINVTKVLASRWCRAHETAELLNVAPVENNAAFDNLEFNRHRAVALIDRERELIATWQGPVVLLIVTHSSNIKQLTGLDIEQGTMIVATPTGESNTTLRFGKMSLQNASS